MIPAFTWVEEHLVDDTPQILNWRYGYIKLSPADYECGDLRFV